MIEIELKWEKSNRIGKVELEPRCHSYFIGDYIHYSNKKIKYFFDKSPIQKNNSYKGYLDVLLIDIGGPNYLKAIPWIEEGIKRIEKVLNELSDEEDWGGEGFLAEIKKEGVLIYFITDDSYFDIIPLNCFYKAVVSWRKFLDTKPDINNIVKISCEE